MNRRPVVKEPRIGALVCGDILGSFTPSKAPKYKYCAVFVDSYSHMSHTYPMVRKSEFPDVFRHLCVTYAAAGYPITRFMTDTDSVMTSADFRDLAVDLGVCLRYSSPYCHWQNGVVERSVYTFKNKTICNLFSSGLPEEWWYAALRHAADTHNATPTRSNPYQASPRDMWHGKLASNDTGDEMLIGRCDESFRRAFGCDAYVRRDDRKSLQPRCDKAVFLGYSPDHAGGVYDFLNLRTGRLCVSRDAVFDERSVTPSVCHDYIVEEGMRTAPDWFDAGDSPFEPDIGVTEPMYTHESQDGMNDGGSLLSVRPSTPDCTSSVDDATCALPKLRKLTKTQLKSKYVNNTGVIDRTSKRAKAAYINERADIIGTLGLRSVGCIGRLVPSKSENMVPYRCSDLTYDCNLGLLAFKHDTPAALALMLLLQSRLCQGVLTTMPNMWIQFDHKMVTLVL